MARRLCQSLLALAVLYGIAVGAFALFHYDGERPDVVTIAGDMHAWVGRLLASRPAPPHEPPGAVPPRKEPLPAPPPAPVEATPAAVPPPSDPRAVAIARVQDVLLPRATLQVAALRDRSATDFESKRADARVTLVEARDLLGAILDEHPDDREVHRLYKQVSDLLIAVDKR